MIRPKNETGAVFPSRKWGRRIYIPQDKQYARYFAVDTAAPLLEAFIGQARAAYQALGLFGPEHCLPDWAREKLEELRGPRQEQTDGPAMGGMAME